MVLRLRRKIVAGDTIDDILNAIEFADKTADLIITTGGLGPTIDDLTRDAISKYTGKELVLYKDEFTKLKERFILYNYVMPERNIRQVMFPAGSYIIENKKEQQLPFITGKNSSFSWCARRVEG